MAIDLAAIEAAAVALKGHHVQTPLLENPQLNMTVGGRVLIKPECLQRTGSFKFRGAFTKIHRLSAVQRANGVVAYSSGNHAQGVAAAAQHFGIPATIVMPEDAPAIKIANTKALGAKVVTYDRWRESREQIGADIATREGAVLVKPYDDEDVIVGQGTVGLETCQQTQAQGLGVDQLYCPCGGGGLMAGIATAYQSLSPDTRLYCVEPEGFEDTQRSLALGRRVSNSEAARSLCDAIVTPTPGELTFAINSRALSGGLSVTDTQVRQAMAFALERLKLVVEPGGCVALAALLAGQVHAEGQTTLLVLSGGNVDLSLLASL